MGLLRSPFSHIWRAAHEMSRLAFPKDTQKFWRAPLVLLRQRLAIKAKKDKAGQGLEFGGDRQGVRRLKNLVDDINPLASDG